MDSMHTFLINEENIFENILVKNMINFEAMTNDMLMALHVWFWDTDRHNGENVRVPYTYAASNSIAILLIHSKTRQFFIIICEMMRYHSMQFTKTLMDKAQNLHLSTFCSCILCDSSFSCVTGVVWRQGLLLLIWFNFNPSMDK